MFGANGHQFPPFKPCYFEMTKEMLPCPLCELRGVPEWQGFLPLYDYSGKRVVVPIVEDFRDQALTLRLHDAVTVHRGTDKYDILTVVRNEKRRWYQATARERQQAADIRHWLIFSLWKSEHQFVNFFTAHPITTPLPPMERAGVPTDKPVENPKFDLKREVLGEVLRQNGHHTTAAQLPPTVDDAINEVGRRLKEKVARAERNGKGG